MIICNRCPAAMSEIGAALSADAIQLLVKREESLGQVVSEPEWRDGPLCDRCLAAWSALIHALEQEKNHK